MPFAQPLLRASGHSRHEAIRKSTEGAGVSVGVAVGGTGVGVAVSTGVGVRVLVGVSVGSGDGVGDGVSVGVDDGVGVNVAVGVDVAVEVGSGVSVAVSVGIGVAVGVAGCSAIWPVQAVSTLKIAAHKITLNIICYSVASLDSSISPEPSGQPTFQISERRSLSGLRAPV